MCALSHVVVDWGTSSFRLWTLDGDGRVLGERRSGQGLAASVEAGFENVLESHLAALGVANGVPVMMCGMVGSRGGWVEAAYVDTPARLEHVVGQAVEVPSARRPIHILPGLAQRNPAQPDVMRGEETQLLGLARQGFGGLACLPGTHSKWVVVEDGAVRSFATFMTGELFQLLRSTSVIAPAVAGAETVDAASLDFAAGLREGLDAPERLASDLFRLRASWLLAGKRPQAALDRLSGVLLGVELAGARSSFGGLGGLALVASGPAAPAYRTALALAGVDGVAAFDADELVRAGLDAAACAAFRPERSLA